MFKLHKRLRTQPRQSIISKQNRTSRLQYLRKNTKFSRRISFARSRPLMRLSIQKPPSSHATRKKKQISKFYNSSFVAKSQFIKPTFNSQFEFNAQSWGQPPTKSLEIWNDNSHDVFWPQELGPVLVVSIRPERMNNFITRMGPWMNHMRRFPATDGRQINTKQWVSSGKVVDRGMTAGRMGCYDSHVRIWEAIASSNYNVVTVLEDDVDWSFAAGAGILSKMKQCFNEIKQVQWDFLSWGHGPWAFGKNQPCGLDNWKKPGTCQGFFAYTLTREFAKQLVKNCKPYKASAVDKWFFDSFVVSRPCNVLCCEPRLCWVVDVVSDTMKTTLVA